MSRTDEFDLGHGGKPLFHGTSQQFKPGDIIYPSTHKNHPDHEENIESRDDEIEDSVDDGTDREDAEEYASKHWDNAWASSSIDNAKGYATRRSTGTPSHNYQVAHLDPSECEGCAWGRNNNAADHTDPKGFRVIREV